MNFLFGQKKIIFPAKTCVVERTDLGRLGNHSFSVFLFFSFFFLIFSHNLLDIIVQQGLTHFSLTRLLVCLFVCLYIYLQFGWLFVGGLSN